MHSYNTIQRPREFSSEGLDFMTALADTNVSLAPGWISNGYGPSSKSIICGNRMNQPASEILAAYAFWNHIPKACTTIADETVEQQLLLPQVLDVLLHICRHIKHGSISSHKYNLILF